MNEGILNCKSLQSVSITNQIYLINNNGNEYVEWSNLNKEEPIYVNLNIKLNWMFYGIIGNTIMNLNLLEQLKIIIIIMLY